MVTPKNSGDKPSGPRYVPGTGTKRPIPNYGRAVQPTGLPRPKQQQRQDGPSYTPSPAVKGASPGKSGGVWRTARGRVVATATSEDAKPTRVAKKSPKGIAPQRRS
jgi:hypothetical protein